jgi:glycerophosphoryl diester phosphodiesterase
MAHPLVIGHRGAPGYRPEHTCASYELAARLGADFLEPDLVATRDGVLVCRHEPEIGSTTDVAGRPEFADRRTTRIIDDQRVHGWFVDDFTLAELGTLRARERLPAIRPGNTRYDGHFAVPTFDEVLALAARLSAELGRSIGVYPETKSPSYFADLGLPLEPPLIAALRAVGWDRADAPVFVQSFEVANLRALAGELAVPLVQLVEMTGAPADFAAAGDPREYRDLLTPAGLAEVAEYARVIGPDKELILGRDGHPSTLVTDAHAAGLAVHAYTFRNENRFLSPSLRSSAEAARAAEAVEARASAVGDGLIELLRFYELGVDAVFCDFPDTGVAARAMLVGGQTIRSSG